MEKAQPTDHKNNDLDDHSADSYHETAPDTSSNNGSSELGGDETKLVLCSKYIVFGVLVFTTSLGAILTYLYTYNEEQDEFESHFDDFALELLEVSEASALSAFATIAAMSLTITSYAEDSNSTWPFVTIPHYEARARQLLELSGAVYLSLNPVITNSQILPWIDYANNNQGWVQEGINLISPGVNATPILPFLFQVNATGNGIVPVDPTTGSSSDPHSPVWLVSPAIYAPSLTNYDLFGDETFTNTFASVEATKSSILSNVINEGSEDPDPNLGWPQSYLTAPVYERVYSTEKIVATLAAVLPWHNYFVNVVPDGTKPIEIVIENTCNQSYTYQVVGTDVKYVGVGDLHDKDYEKYAIDTDFITTEGQDGVCAYKVSAYPTEAFRRHYLTLNPFIYTVGVVIVFFLTSAVFAVYDCMVERRQDTVLSSAKRSDAIVSSLFPAQVRARLMEDQEQQQKQSKKTDVEANKARPPTTHAALSRVLEKNTSPFFGSGHIGDEKQAQSHENAMKSKPIADLFPHATVLFADIAGFTAWSSTREPAQVFVLLETIYNSFDLIANKRRVFKVETIGDCYLAATGLPDARDDHAEAMAKFARECRVKMNQIVKELEVTLGPDTADLAIRVGIHSGPVTAGVLRGEKSRFQLFGDTVNTASRIETTGIRDQIHLSQETAHLLIAAGKGDWVEMRDTLVSAKGKGEIQTYWLKTGEGSINAAVNSFNRIGSNGDLIGLPISSSPSAATGASTLSLTVPKSPGSSHDSSTSQLLAVDTDDEKTKRLVDWNVEALSQPLKLLVALRQQGKPQDLDDEGHNAEEEKKQDSMPDRLSEGPHNGTVSSIPSGQAVLDQVEEVIDFQSKATSTATSNMDPSTIELHPDVVAELRDYVAVVASLHQKNSFHNFEHASHVVQSVSKLFSRISEADGAGVPCDPLTQFACFFSALIHDVDHPGVPNAQLVQEEADMAQMYKNQSVAEQNSLNISWDLLMEPLYSNLRSCIYKSDSEMEHFRQVVINSVLATDIVDKELSKWRIDRWETAFCPSNKSNMENEDVLDQHKQSLSSSFKQKNDETVNRKATIVIEHLIQASDIAHTMQHWHVYLKWNERLFHEMYDAYLSGRAQTDPSKGWYEGEIGFFDYYIIPLAKKLKECGVFGVASDEYLNYAIANRAEWKSKGKTIVQNYITVHNNN